MLHVPGMATPGIRTARLWLRPWRAADAPLLLPVLEANTAHLQGWIPDHVWRPVPLPELAERLDGFAADFAAARSWRFAILSSDRQRVMGEVSAFPRSAEGRVQLAAADRLEIGYWLDAADTGRGLITEAVRALLPMATELGMRRIEIRCDPRNERSAAIPQRLGFQLESANETDMVWVWIEPT
jgi:RimJ/RimL family protein N-acetyltransferase